MRQRQSEHKTQLSRWLVMRVVWCCKDQCCIGTWNVRSMNEGKLEVVKQETARVNIDILGISELKWTGVGEFNSDGHFIYYCVQESLRRNGVSLIVNKSPKLSTSVQYQKWQNNLCSIARQPFKITVIQLYDSTTDAKEAEVEWFYEDLWDFLEWTSKKDILYHYMGLECKSRKSKDTWSNRQVWPWSTKWGRDKANSFAILLRTDYS